MTTPLLEVRNLKVYFPQRSGALRRVTGHIKAVDGVDLTIAPGEVVGLAGESGSGRTTFGRAILPVPVSVISNPGIRFYRRSRR